MIRNHFLYWVSDWTTPGTGHTRVLGLFQSMKHIYTFMSLCFTFFVTLDLHVPEVVLLTAHLSYTHNSMPVSLSPQKLHLTK